MLILKEVLIALHYGRLVVITSLILMAKWVLVPKDPTMELAVIGSAKIKAERPGIWLSNNAVDDSPKNRF